MRGAEPSAPRFHGGVSDLELERLGICTEQILDLSVNLNPYGPSNAVHRAALEAPMDRYPEATSARARRVIAGRLDCAADRIVVGNGACELLWTVVQALLGPGSRVLVVEPTFSELAAAARQGDCQVSAFRLAEEDGFKLDLSALDARIERDRPALVSLCCPNNPTATGAPVADIQALAARHQGVHFCLDQAFLSLSEQAEDLAALPRSNVIFVRSLTKEQGIPGVRIGYLVCSPRLAARLETGRPTWTVSAAAQAVAEVAMMDRGFVDDSRRTMLRDRDRTAAVLTGVGLSPVPSVAPFLLVRAGNASGLRSRLLQSHRICIRDCASFGLPNHVRLAGVSEAWESRLQRALEVEL